MTYPLDAYLADPTMTREECETILAGRRPYIEDSHGVHRWDVARATLRVVHGVDT